MSFLYAAGVIALGLIFAALFVIDWLCRDQLKRARRKDTLGEVAGNLKGTK